LREWRSAGKGPPNNKVDKSMNNSYRMLDDQVCQKGS
jgi:hypothetical protein